MEREKEATRELSALEYAKEKGLSLDWVYRQLWLGKIPAARRDGRWVILEPARPA